MITFDSIVLWILGTLLILSALGVILSKKPVHSAISFLFTLILLSAIYLQLSAEFIAAMQVLIYAGAILVLFMFVIVLFQDAHVEIDRYRARSLPFLLLVASLGFLGTVFYLAPRFFTLSTSTQAIPKDFGTVEALGVNLYVDFFFPFEAVILLFLIAVVGALYIGRKGKLKERSFQ